MADVGWGDGEKFPHFLDFSEHHIWSAGYQLKSTALARIADHATHGEGAVFMKAITVPRPKKKEN